MKNIFRLLTLTLCLPLLLYPAPTAGASEVKGNASVTYDASFFSGSPPDDVREKALSAAKLSAWKNYIASKSPSDQKQYQKIEQDILNNLDDYLSDVTVIAEKVDKDKKAYSIAVRVNVNDTAFNLRINSSASTSSGEGSMFSFMFVARELTESKEFADKQTAIVQLDVDRSSSSRDSLDGGGASVAQSSSERAMAVSGGNVERKGAREKYSLLATTDFDSAFNQVLTDFGYEIIDYTDVVSECGGARENEIKNEFAAKDEVSDVVRKKAIAGARDCEVRFFALGFMNVGLAARDSVSGELKVPVSVNGQVWNLDKRLPTRVASVGPVQFFGLGPDKNTARRNALDLAAKKAAQIIASQLSSKNLN